MFEPQQEFAMSTYLTAILTAASVWMAGQVPSGAATLLPDFSAATFLPSAPITNPFFPAPAGRTQTLSGNRLRGPGPAFEQSVLTVLGPGPDILGVTTTTLRDRAYEDGLLVEETFDHYAQDSQRNVWYFGEDVTNYEYDDQGNLIGTNSASSWRAGVSGALPGYAMPNEPLLGLSYFQEYAPEDAALDQALIYAVDQAITIGKRTYTGVLVTFETSSLDPDLRELKYYAPGVGLIRADEGVDFNFANPSLILSLAEPAPVPVPAGAPLALTAMGLLGLLRWRRRWRLRRYCPSFLIRPSS